MPSRSQRHLREFQGKDSTGSTGGGPAVTTVPTIAGTAQQGQTLTRTNGTFSGTPTPTITTQWYRNSTAIAGATGATYVVQAGDVGAKIKVRNTARNSVGTVTADSAQTATVT